MRTTRGSRSRRLLGRPASVASGWARSSEAPSGLRRIEAPIDSRLVQRRLGQERATDRRDDRSRSLTLSLIEDPTSPAEAWRGARAARLALQLKLSLPRLISSSRVQRLDRRIASFQPEFWPEGETNKLTPFLYSKGIGPCFLPRLSTACGRQVHAACKASQERASTPAKQSFASVDAMIRCSTATGSSVGARYSTLERVFGGQRAVSAISRSASEPPTLAVGGPGMTWPEVEGRQPIRVVGCRRGHDSGLKDPPRPHRGTPWIGFRRRAAAGDRRARIASLCVDGHHS
jgi:hypothetical protein